MAVNENLKQLVDLSAPYWAGEAEVACQLISAARDAGETNVFPGAPP